MESIIYKISEWISSPFKTFRRSLYIISRWSLLTWSYSRRLFREAKWFSSTFFCAFSTERDSIRCSIGMPSLIPRFSKMEIYFSEPNKRSRSSSREIKNFETPGSPCRPERPLSWLSTLRLSERSVPITYRPPASLDLLSSFMSVPRPAILVAIVTALNCPAFATIAASISGFFAFSTLWAMPFFRSISDKISETSIVSVPTKIGWPFLWIFRTLFTIAAYFSALVLYTESLRSFRMIGRLVGIWITSIP